MQSLGFLTTWFSILFSILNPFLNPPQSFHLSETSCLFLTVLSLTSKQETSDQEFSPDSQVSGEKSWPHVDHFCDSSSCSSEAKQSCAKPLSDFTEGCYQRHKCARSNHHRLLSSPPLLLLSLSCKSRQSDDSTTISTMQLLVSVAPCIRTTSDL